MSVAATMEESVILVRIVSVPLDILLLTASTPVKSLLLSPLCLSLLFKE